MDAVTPAPTSKKVVWAGWVMSILPALMLLMSAVMKLSRHPQAVEGFTKMGYPGGALLGIGIAELVCTIIYLIPQTAVLGAILLTGYLGGAIDVHVRGGESIHIPLALGIFIWGGLFLRDPRIRALIPFRKPLKN
jgi:hypothetical protein